MMKLTISLQNWMIRHLIKSIYNDKTMRNAKAMPLDTK